MENVKVVSEIRAFDGYLKVDKAVVLHEKENGDTVTYDRFKLVRPNAVAVLIVNTDTEKVILVKQFRYPIADKEPNGVLEIVAGKMDEGETPAQSVVREVMEEVGYKIGESDLSEPTISYPSPGYSSEKIYVYMAFVDDSMKVSKGGGVETEHESIEIIEIDLQEFMRMVRDGEIIDAKTLIGAHKLFVHSLETLLEKGATIKAK